LLVIALGDTEAAVTKVMKDVKLPVVADTEGALGDLYGIQVLPTTVFVDSRGGIGEALIGGVTADELSQIALSLD